MESYAGFGNNNYITSCGGPFCVVGLWSLLLYCGPWVWGKRVGADLNEIHFRPVCHKSGHPNTDVFWPRYQVYGVSTAGTTIIDVIAGNTVW